MASQDKGGPLPKFGEWDVNNPASADGFTVIFNKARDQRKTSSGGGSGGKDGVHNQSDSSRKDGVYKHNKRDSCRFPRTRKQNKWLCCG